jgi:hypothetical protein
MQVLQGHLVNYLKEKNITFADELSSSTFDDYLLYRKDSTKLTRKKELVIIKNFVIEFMVKNKFMVLDATESKSLVPRVSIRKQDLDANPAINADDWRIINAYIRNVYVKKGELHPRPSVHYWRMLFWTFTIVAKIPDADQANC